MNTCSPKTWRQNGQSLVSRELRRQGGKDLREVDKNTLLSAWVMKLPGVTEDFARFEKFSAATTRWSVSARH